MSFVATGVGAGSLAALGTSGLIAATPALATAGGLGTAGALTGGGLLASTAPSVVPALSQGGGVYTGGFNSLQSGLGPTQIPKGIPTTPGMFDGLGGALETGLENLNKVAQPAANISQAVSPFMSEGQGIQASPIAPPTYSNNLNEIVAQNEQTDQQRMEDEMMRRMEQRQRIQAMGEMA